jgi:DNA helicase-2/ATP-dependent DNA helicase PcrA
VKTTDAFDELYAQLNSRQREAVDAIDGPVMVIAGPGTGKTKILTLRIANILARTDTPPEAVLALTFTESGAAEMKGRLAAIIGHDAYRVTVTTFHSFCNNVIQEYPDAFGPLAGAASMTEADQAVILQELIDTTAGLELLRPVNAPDLYLKAVLGSISTLKLEGITPDRLQAIATSEERAVMNADDLYHEKGAYKGRMKGMYEDALKHVAKLRELATLYGAYQDALRARRVYDYNDMVMEVARALESDEQLRLILQERHQYILVDEHQDTNNAQNKVIELLASFWERPNLFIVGDEKQAIYRFQGASLENFHYFKTKYPDVKLIELEHNYRSSQLILDAAQGIRPSAGDGLRSGVEREDAPIRLLSLSAPPVQYFTVARMVQSQLEAGVAPDAIAVLYRDNADGQALAEYFDRLAIPYGMSSQADALADPYLHQLILILDVLRQFGVAGPLYLLLHAPVMGIDPLDVYKLLEFCRKGRNPFDVMRSPALMHEAGIDGAARMQQLSAQLASWSRASQQPEAAEALERVVRESGVLAAIVADVDAPDSLSKLHALYDMLKAHIQRDRTLALSKFATHLEFLRARGIAVTAGTGGMLPGRVRLMTAHKSKGLEFDHVYLIDCVDGHWGSRVRRQLIKLPQAVYLKSKTAITSDEPDDEDRNLFYVALTRARRDVVITMSQTGEDGKQLLPARYIADIRPALITQPDTAPFESAWTAGSDMRFGERPARTPQSKDKAYLNDLFARQGLSVTALNHYLDCPWSYFYTSLLRIPEAPSFALMYGNAVDRALTDYFDKLKDGTKGTREELVALFEAFITHQPLQDADLQTALKRGRTALAGYYDTYHATWKSNVINQLRIPAVALANDVTINGKIDKVELLDASGAVLVTDYKTGKTKSRAQIAGTVKDGDGNYLRQLTFYKLLLDRWQDGKYRMHEGVIDFVEPDARGKYRREVFVIPPVAVKELEQEIQRVADEIRTLAFWNTRCDDRDCAYCALRDLMEK